MPQGLSMTQRSYADEAGDARALPGRISAADHKQLAAIKLPTGSLDKAVDAWTKAAKKLGALEDERVSLEAKIGAASPARGTLVDARNRFVRLARLLDATVEAHDVPAPVAQDVLGKLHAEDKKAERKSRKSPATGAADGAAPAPDATPPKA